MSSSKYEVIIIGAGPAGLAAACKLARAGVEVVVVERGDYPGSKNVSGGALYSRVLDKLIPGFWQEAPVERYVTSYITSLTTTDDYINLEYRGKALGDTPYNAVSVLRGKFDRWLAEQAEAAGAMIVTGIKVENVLQDGRRVIGICTGEEEMLADVVIAADGINSFIAQAAGLRGLIKQEHLSVGTKALIELPQDLLEERFRLKGKEGAAYAIVGAASRGVAGGAFLYTNLASISVGVVLRLDDLVRQAVQPADVLDELLAHPLVAPLVKDGKMVEYGAHLTGEGGLNMVPSRLYAAGLLIAGDAAGFTINNGLVIRGMDLAIASGLAAADTVIQAKAGNDFSENALSGYLQNLDQLVMRDMKLYARMPAFMDNRRLYTQYAPLITDVLGKAYRHNLAPREHLCTIAGKSLRASGISLLNVIKDGIKGARAL
ncbi:FAD-dependent oxidoreductase [Sporomusa aerivorans]|uniref:FAD-dependent oxidoreductase n=1 Tax=Sporomusa aerivorans TaxID=204936 RepID=UPI00352AEEA4